MNIKTKLIALGGSAACIAGLVVSASGATGAYFSDTVAGAIHGTSGQVVIETTGGASRNNPYFTWDNLLPGVPQSATVTYKNTGTVPEDIYLTFPNLTALSALNNLGSYGAVHISTTYGSTLSPVFDSANLNDHVDSCGPFAPSGCWPVPAVNPLQSGLGVGQTASFTFTFNYASKMTTGQGAAFNVFPQGPTTPGGQQFYNPNGTNPVVAPSSGLPFNVVATQGGPAPTVGP